MNGSAANFLSVGSGNGADQFPDPFLDVASRSMPQNWRRVLYWCEHLFERFGTYRMAMERIVSYFLTEVEIGGSDVSDEEKEKQKKFYTQTLEVITVVQNMLRDRMCYGNSFCSLLVPFKRMLLAPSGDMYSLAEVHDNPQFRFEFSNMEFIATCPKTKKRCAWKVVDHADDKEQKLKIKRWSPHEIEILHDLWTDEVAYLWRIPEEYKRQVREGRLFHLERVAKPVLDAIKRGDRYFRFHPDVMFHMKEPTLAGQRNRGWGMPRIISNFRQIYYVQVLRRYNEAIALDYVIPFRVLTPDARSGGGSAGLTPSMDLLQSFNSGDFKAQIDNMIRRRRFNPTGWQTLSFPLNYQILGGDAKNLAPRDLHDQGLEQLLNDAGTPQELYNGTLQLQTAPVALRLFEATFAHLVNDCNSFLRWLSRQVSQLLSWERVDCSLKRVTVADDINRQMMLLQLMTSQMISGHSGLQPLGLDWKTENKQLAEESLENQRIQARLQEEAEQAGFAAQIAAGQAPGQEQQQAGGGAPGGAPAGGGGGGDPAAGGGMPGGTGMPVTSYLQSMNPDAPVSLSELESTAQQLADELMGLPESLKDSELRKLSQAHETLHGLVKKKMEQARNTAKQQGGAAMLAQTYGQQPAGQPA